MADEGGHQGVRQDGEAMRSALDIAIDDAWHRAAASQEHRRQWSRRCVDLKHQRGDYPVLQALDEATLEGLAVELEKDMESPR